MSHKNGKFIVCKNINCENIFYISKSRFGRIKYCSVSCGKKGKPSWNKGVIYNQIRDNKHWAWKGPQASYRALHYWVQKRLGKALQCSNHNCANKSTVYQWANISRKYKRNLKDWISLCVACHSLYDRGRLKLKN